MFFALLDDVETCEKEDKWKFVFLAANQDAIKTGSSIGIKGSNSITYSATTTGASNVFQTVSNNMTMYRSAKFSGMDLDDSEKSLFFSDAQRDEAKLDSQEPTTRSI